MLRITFFVLVYILATITWSSSENELEKFDLKQYENFYNCFPCNASKTCCEIMCGDVTLPRLRVYDASFKGVVSGILDGNKKDLGKFDECLETKEMFNGNEWAGKHCMAETNKKFAYGYCLPSVCSGKDFELLIATSENLTVDEEDCDSKTFPHKYDAAAIVGLVIISVTLAIVAASTLYEFYLQYKEQDAFHELLLAFSLLRNFKHLLLSTNNPNQLLCLNGIKTFSIMWILLGHQFIVFLFAVDNYNTMVKISTTPELLFLPQNEYAVDSFFVISGMLVVYTFLKSAEKGSRFNVLKFYGHRYLRLTPVVAFLIYFHASLLKYVADGPLWGEANSVLVAPCRDWWWSSLLYVQNYVNVDNLCIPPSWYISVDCQLHLLTPLILLPLKKWPHETAYFGIIGLTILLIIFTFIISFVEELPAFLYLESGHPKGKIYSHLYYYNTLTRASPYVIGMLLGYFIYNYKKSTVNIKIPTVRVILIWVVCIAGLFACIYGSHDARLKPYNRFGHSLSLALSRPSWAFIVSAIIYLCVTGHGGPINAFLSHAVFQVLTKLCYTTYLIHFTVILVKYTSVRTQVHFSIHQHALLALWAFYNGENGLGTILLGKGHELLFLCMINGLYASSLPHLSVEHTTIQFTDFWGSYVVSLVFSLSLWLTFERPFLIIDKYVFGKDEAKIVPEKKTEKYDNI